MPPAGYDSVDTRNGQQPYPSSYYSSAAYSPAMNQPVYSPVSPSSPPYPHPTAPRHPNLIQRPQSTVPYPHHGHSHSMPYAPSPMQSGGGGVAPVGRARSNSTAYNRLPSPASPPPAPYEHSYPQTIGLSPDFPPSPTRPFACDLCALSFNRQHDLKRHRETHTGEKPFLCNGGCGKTFTRKDALKRHQVSCLLISGRSEMVLTTTSIQLVKGCGKVEEY